MFDIIFILLTLIVIVYKILLPKNSQFYRHGSFAPVRGNSQALWYVDGRDYMSAVADAIEAAETEILITDWQMNPEIFMKRPDSGVDGLYWRLDKMLLRKADEGVRVKILLYHEIQLAVDLGSKHVEKLLDTHEKIEVHRHPDIITNALNLFRWSHHEKLVIVDRDIAFVGGIDLCYGRWDTHKHELMDNYPIHSALVGTQALDNQGKPFSPNRYARWIGKDYKNTFCNKDEKTDWDKPLKGYRGVERNAIPRMPWHDVSCAFIGKAVLDSVTHFTDRYNNATKKIWWAKYLGWSHEFLRITAHHVRQRVTKKTSRVGAHVFNSGGHQVNIQFLRSVADWSAGMEHEASIHCAYVEAIKNAQHFIYIENQFFISSQNGSWGKVQNEIQSALVERIVRAYKANEDFHVMIVIPLKPEFHGDWDDNDGDGKALRTVTFWVEATLYRGEDSLISKLDRENISKEVAMKYFSVFSLRQYDLIGTHFVTEIVYVHSKIMIVDDRLVIIGSANINDRSMLGDRDSEVAVMIEDLEFLDGKMNGVRFMMGKFAHSLRCGLLKEHLGVFGDDEEDISIDDPLGNNSIEDIRDRAEMNNSMFLKVFGSDVLRRENTDSLSRENTKSVQDILEQIKGNLVAYPPLARELKPSKIDQATKIFRL